MRSPFKGWGFIMRRKRGNSVVGTYDEELRRALAGNPNFVQAPNCRGSYAGTGAEAATAVADASDPLYTPTASAEMADMEGVDSPVRAATLPRRSKRLRPFYVDREVEPVSAYRRTRETCELLSPREGIRDRQRLLVIQVSSSSDDSGGSAESLGAGCQGARRPIRSPSYEFADDNFPPTNTSSAPLNQIIHKSPESEMSTVTTPQAHRRKQNRPHRGPIM